jgi:hypothetical protein
VSLLIVDASVAVKWFFEEEHAGAALSVRDPRHERHAPDFFLVEMDSVLAKFIRRGVLTLADAEQARLVLRETRIQLHPSLPLLDSAWTIANQTRAGIYDSLYLALAVLLKGKVVTADRKLLRSVARTPFAKQVVWVEDVA